MHLHIVVAWFDSLVILLIVKNSRTRAKLIRNEVRWCSTDVDVVPLRWSERILEVFLHAWPLSSELPCIRKQLRCYRKFIRLGNVTLSSHRRRTSSHPYLSHIWNDPLLANHSLGFTFRNLLPQLSRSTVTFNLTFFIPVVVDGLMFLFWTLAGGPCWRMWSTLDLFRSQWTDQRCRSELWATYATALTRSPRKGNRSTASLLVETWKHTSALTMYLRVER